VPDHLAQHHRCPSPDQGSGAMAYRRHTTHVSEHISHGRGRTRPEGRTTSGQTCDRSAPETHQNLIHSNKDQAPGLVPGGMPIKGRFNGITKPSTEQIVETTCPGIIPATPNLLLLRDTASCNTDIGRRHGAHLPGGIPALRSVHQPTSTPEPTSGTWWR